MKIIHRETDELIAEGERGWVTTPFEGNLYISGKALRIDGFKANYAVGRKNSISVVRQPIGKHDVTRPGQVSR